MIQIRVGDNWRHDPGVRSALRRARGAARAAAVSRIADALAIEVDGVDLVAGRTEGPLLPSLEGLLRALARLLGGAEHASASLREGELVIVLRRRGASALLTAVEPGPPSRVLARDVEVELDGLVSAALAASADLVRALAEAEPGVSELPGPRRLQAAARAVRRRGVPDAPPARTARPIVRRGHRLRSDVHAGSHAVSCAVELEDDDGLIEAYAGGRPDLGSLLAPGAVILRARDGTELARAAGAPFLALRDLVRAADGVVAAIRRGDPSVTLPFGRARRGPPPALRLDVAAETVQTASAGNAGGPRARTAAVPCPPLDLAAAIFAAATDFARAIRSRNPRQGENAYLADLASAAAAGLAHVAELAEGDVVRKPADAGAVRAAFPAAPSQRPLAPGRLRRVAFRRVLAFEVGAPGGEALHRAGSLVVACGAHAVTAVPVAGGAPAWRAPGVQASTAVGGLLLLARDTLEAVSFRTGARRWSRAWGGEALAATALARGPILLSAAGALTAVDPGSGRTLWRFSPPGARRLWVTAFGGLAVAGTDGALLYGLDAAGGLAWRLRLPGSPLFAPVAAGAACVVACATAPGATLVAVEPAAGRRLWEAPLQFAPSAPPLPSRGRLAVAGTVAGDPVVAALDARGRPAWTAAPALHGPLALAPGPRGTLIGRDGNGALVALDRAGAVLWQTPAPAGHLPPGHLPPRVVRAAVLAPQEDLAVHDAATGALLGTAPNLAPVRLLVDPELRVAAMDAEGVVTVLRLATHLSVV